MLYYRWLANPVTDAELAAAYRANALFDAHQDDPEFGYRYLADEARDANQDTRERTAWRIAEVGSMSKVGAAGDNAAMESSFALLQKRAGPLDVDNSARSCGSRSSPGLSAPTTGAAGQPL